MLYSLAGEEVAKEMSWVVPFSPTAAFSSGVWAAAEGEVGETGVRRKGERRGGGFLKLNCIGIKTGRLSSYSFT